MVRFDWTRIDLARVLTGIALVVGWIGIYFAFQGHWLGIALPLVDHRRWPGGAAAGRRDRARRRSAALRDALAASAARNRELERLRHLAATLLAGTELAPLLQEVGRRGGRPAPGRKRRRRAGGRGGPLPQGGRRNRAARPTLGRLVPVDESLARRGW